MKYYKVINQDWPKDYVLQNCIYKENWIGYKKEFNYRTLSNLLEENPEYLNEDINFEEVSKQEYLLFKVKELKTKILDRNNGFYTKGYKETKMFFDILRSLDTPNLHQVDTIMKKDDILTDYYIEQKSMVDCWSYRALQNSDKYIKEYNLNLINFKDLIDEIKQIRDE